MTVKPTNILNAADDPALSAKVEDFIALMRMALAPTLNAEIDDIAMNQSLIITANALFAGMTVGHMIAVGALRWDEVTDLAIRRTAAKRSRGRRFRVTLPRLPELDALLEQLRARKRKPGVETVLVNSYGQPWTGDGLASSFHDARRKANGGTGIHHVERDPVTGEERRIAKRLHDFRGTYATRLMTHPTARLTDREIAELMGWSERQVGDIRRNYVDDAAIVVALGKRLARQSGKRTGKRRAKI